MAAHRKPPRIAFYRPVSQIATMTILMTAGVFVALADGMPRELYIAPRLAAATTAVPGHPGGTPSVYAWLIIVGAGFLFAIVLAVLIWGFTHETNPGRHASKPLPDPDPDDWDDSEDGVADWARSIASPLRKRLISPLVTARTELTALLLIAQRVRAGLPTDDLVQPPAPDADPDRNQGTAAVFHCAFCGAPPGEPCRTVRGLALPLPHYSWTAGTARLDMELHDELPDEPYDEFMARINPPVMECGLEPADARPDSLALTAITPAILARVRTGLAALPDNARAGNWTPRPELPAAPADTEPATSWDLKAIDNGTPAAAAAPPDDWRAHLDWCLTAPVDQVKALSR